MTVLTMILCTKCGWAALGLSESDTAYKINSHHIKTACDGDIQTK